MELGLRKVSGCWVTELSDVGDTRRAIGVDGEEATDQFPDAV